MSVKTITKRPIEYSHALMTKRPRTDVVVTERRREIYSAGDFSSIPRTSNLKAPNMLLSGHKGELFCGKFSPEGSFLATAGHDREIYIWNTYGECENIAVMSGHNGAILDLQFSSDSEWIYTASTDKTIMIWDAKVGQRVKKFKGHPSIVNSVSVVSNNRELFCSGADDAKIRLWDKRNKNTVHTIDGKYPVSYFLKPIMIIYAIQWFSTIYFIHLITDYII